MQVLRKAVDSMETHGQPTLQEFLTDTVINTLYFAARKNTGQWGSVAQELVHEHFVCKYESYCRNYDPDKGVPFEPYCVGRFGLIARREYARATRANEGKKDVMKDAQRLYATSSDDGHEHASSIEPASTDNNLTAVIEGVTYDELIQALSHIPPDQSWVVWNHSHGFSLDSIADRLGKSRNTISDLYRGGIDSLRRELDVEVGQ